MIVAAGGVPVLAHPATYGKYRPMDDSVIRKLRDAGLFGLEVGHRDNTAEGKVRLTELAAKLGLELTGSSDYHGVGKPNRLGENETAPDVLEKLIGRGTGSQPYYG
jgi:predicted metal-dependent phosphoesterase TrpH